LFSPQAYHLMIKTHRHYFHLMVNNYMFKTIFNFSTTNKKRCQENNTLKRGKDWYHINRSVSLSPPYLIHQLIHHPRTSSKKGLCGLRVETDTKLSKCQKTSTNKKTPLFNTASLFKKRMLRKGRAYIDRCPFLMEAKYGRIFLKVKVFPHDL
jgi:hypothetical protein